MIGRSHGELGPFTAHDPVVHGGGQFQRTGFRRLRSHNSKFTRLNLTKFLIHVTYGCGNVILWRRFDTLYTSGFVDGVMCLHNGICRVHKLR